MRIQLPVIPLTWSGGLWNRTALLLTTACLAKILASRGIQLSRQPKPGDAMDVAHLTHLPYADVFIHDRAQYNLTKGWDTLFGTGIVYKPDAALRHLKGLW